MLGSVSFLDAKPAVPADAAGVEPEAEPVGGGLFRRPVKPLKPAATGELPNRYPIKEDAGGRYLSCLEAPEVRVRLERRQSVSASAARKAPEGTIFVDGAAQGEPFLDLERRVYNLDHHEGCVRPFTLAACEQALVLVCRGLDLRERPWTVIANEPDLDTVMAIWVLVNSMHLKAHESPIRRVVIPLVRLEGLIDVHGLEFRELTGFPEGVLSETFQKLERLREREKALKGANRWHEADPLDYLVEQLRELDGMVYPPDFFEAFPGFEELAKVELTDHKIAIVCRCECGIYELEKDLKRLYGPRLGVIVLQKDERTYTLRQVDPFLPVNLEAAYRKLNVLDPAAESGGAANRWGGSGEIGGSPRQSGTDLKPGDIAEACRLAYRRPPLKERLVAIGFAALAAAGGVGAGWLAISGLLPGLPDDGLRVGAPSFLAGSLAAALVLLLALAHRRRRRLYGLQLPEGRDWLFVAPAVVLGALAGGVWALAPAASAALPGAVVWLVLAAGPLAAELLFRGAVHGILSRVFRVQHSSGRWLVSWPVVISAVLFAAATWGLSAALPVPLGRLWPAQAVLLVPLGALVAGLALGVARERSGSLLASLALHYVGILAVLLLRPPL